MTYMTYMTNMTHTNGSVFAIKGKRTAMNVKRIFGITLTILGIFGLIYAATLFVNGNGSKSEMKSLIVYGILGAIFFFTGIGLVKTTHDDGRPPVE
jgi:uncharacterized membrane protein